jgi:CubicO group peptidase (beta-lactamase class C family)
VLDRAVALVEEAVARGVFPGGQLAVGDRGEPILDRTFGALEPGGAAVTSATLYDVASVTKAVVTTTLALRLIEAGRFTLFTPAAMFVPDLEGPKLYIRVRDLLAHASGLPGWRPFYERIPPGAPRETLARLAAAEELEAPPGAISVYSDLGFILLGELVERAGGARLDELARRDIFAPLGMQRSRFVDLNAPERPTDVAPTEVCPRRGLVRGEVHDENCHAAGGICGHAGLFSTAGDLARFAQAMCASWHGRGPFPRDLTRQFLAPSGVPASTWRLGWDGPADVGSRIGDRWPRDGSLAFGFTGCSVVLDPARERWVVLVTNRVHPSRTDERIRQLRPVLHDASVEELG